MKYLKGLVLMGVITMISGCSAGGKLDSYSEMKPPLELESYFNGPVKAWGIVQDRSGKVTRRFSVDMVGEWQGDTGTLTENFEYFDGSVIPESVEKIFMLNHYWAKDLEFFRSNKLNRIHIINKGLNKEQVEERIQNRINENKNMSTTYDDAILKYVPELRRRVFGKESDNLKAKE